MAPQPVEDIDLPALGDQVLELLVALWELVRNVSLVIWDTVCQVSWAVWTYPPFETFRNELAAFIILVFDYVAAHPIATIALVLFVLVGLPWVLEALMVTVAAIFILAIVLVMTVLNAIKLFFLHCLGFTRRGALRGSYAANYQSTGYGGNVPRNSTFAHFQSQGSTGYRGVDGAGYSSWY